MDANEDPQHRLHELLLELSDIIGPQAFYPEHVNTPAMLSEWVSVLLWVDQNGAPFITQIGSRNLLEHHAVGLLHSALYGDFGHLHEEDD